MKTYGDFTYHWAEMPLSKEELENFGEIVMGSSYLSSVLPGTFEIIKENIKYQR